jgi:hypothetical protein
MSDLNYSIIDIKDEQIANYLGVQIQVVEVARKLGAKTYQEVYDFSKTGKVSGFDLIAAVELNQKSFK